MKYSLPSSYYRLMSEEIQEHYLLFWDPDRERFMDEGGFEVDIQDLIPLWAMRLAEINRGVGTENYFCFTPNSHVLVEIFWPDEEIWENYYC